MTKMDTKNHKFSPKGDWDYTSKPATKEELEKARARADKLMRKAGQPGIRSCWQCNGAHAHFLQGDWGDWVLTCFECGKWYCDKIDITIYGDDAKRN
jgi:hypothetical protein